MTVGSALPILAVLPSGFGSCCHFFYLLMFFYERFMYFLFQRPSLFCFGRLLLMHLQLPLHDLIRVGRILLQWILRPKTEICSKLFFLAGNRQKVFGQIPRAIQDASQAMLVVIRSGHRWFSFPIPIRICTTRSYFPSVLVILVPFGFLLIDLQKKRSSYLCLFYFTNMQRFVAL